jgi:hypothetical protein
LRAGDERSDPKKLSTNEGRCFQGAILQGSGFTLTPAERDALTKKNEKNVERIFPYLGGEEVNTSPSQAFDRYVINFGDLDLDEAAKWPDLMAIVRERVKPERDRLRDDQASARISKARWWQFYAPRTERFQAIRAFRRCLVSARVTSHWCPSFQPTNRVFSDQLLVFLVDDDAHFAVMQSRVHEPWARLLSSSLEDRLRYAPSDCFETFPFPQDDRLSVQSAVTIIGGRLYAARETQMLAAQRGLTSTYNDLKDPLCTGPRIVALRKMHEELDRAVLDAYGWTDVKVPPYCPASDVEMKAVTAFEDEVIDRLFALNAERAKEEELLGLGGKRAGPAKTVNVDAGNGTAPKKKVGRNKKAESDGQGGLF